jgi:hypothetical protein
VKGRTGILNQELDYWGRIMASRFNTFTCPNCNALYQLVKVEAGPETADQEIACGVCGGPLVARDGKFVLKYFFLRKGTRRWRSATWSLLS